MFLGLRRHIALTICPELDPGHIWTGTAPIPSDAPMPQGSSPCQGSPACGHATEPGPESIPGSADPANHDRETRAGVSQVSWLEAPAQPFVARPIDGAMMRFRYLGAMPEGSRK